jgi:HlyD family secretion protein
MHVDLMLNESMLNRIRIGMTAVVTSSSFPDTVIRAQLNRISPFLNPQSYSTTAELDVSNAGRLLRPGMFVSVDILYGRTETATLVPNSALFKHPRQGSEGVFVAPAMAKEITFEDEPGSRTPQLYGPTGVEFRSVRVIARGRELSAVAGLTEGDWVVTLGHQMLVQNVAEARVRMVEWPHILELQRLQTRDLNQKINVKADS